MCCSTFKDSEEDKNKGGVDSFGISYSADGPNPHKLPSSYGSRQQGQIESIPTERPHSSRSGLLDPQGAAEFGIWSYGMSLKVTLPDHVVNTRHGAAGAGLRPARPAGQTPHFHFHHQPFILTL